eukprot:3024437-Pyramimonas_sp.AAC.1
MYLASELAERYVTGRVPLGAGRARVVCTARMCLTAHPMATQRRPRIVMPIQWPRRSVSVVGGCCS